MMQVSDLAQSSAAPVPHMRLANLDPRTCRALWAEVLLMAWRDVFPEARSHGGGADSGEGLRYRTAAIAWFGSRDFHRVATLAGFDGSAVMDRFRARLGSEGVGK